MFFSLFLSASLIISVIAMLIYFSERSNILSFLEFKEKIKVKEQARIIELEFRTIVSDLLVQKGHSALQAYLKNKDKSNLKALAREFQLFSLTKGIYDQIRFIDNRGIEKVRVNYKEGNPIIVPENRLQFKGDRYYFHETLGLDSTCIYASPFDLNIEGGEIEKPFKPIIRIGSPVIDSFGEKRGIVILNYLGNVLIDKLKNSMSTGTGKLMLLNSEGYWMISPYTEDEWDFMFEKESNKTFEYRYPAIWKRLKDEENGHIVSNEGVFTFQTVETLKEVNSLTMLDKKVLTSNDINDYTWKAVSYI